MALLDAHAPTWLPIDPVSGNRLIIEPEHGAVHDGTHFMLTYGATVATAAGTLNVLLTTPTTAQSQYNHFICSVEADKGASWTFSEAPETTAGSALTTYNNNRLSANVSLTAFLGNVTVVSTGTILETHIIGSAGTAQSKTGGGVGARSEWLLKPATDYLIRCTTTETTTRVLINVPYYYRP